MIYYMVSGVGFDCLIIFFMLHLYEELACLVYFLLHECFLL